MRRYAVTGRDGETRVVGVERAEDGRVHFTVEDEAYAYDARRLPGQVIHLLTGSGGSYDAVIEWAGGEDRLNGEVAVGLKGQVYQFDVIDERKLRMRQAVGGGGRVCGELNKQFGPRVAANVQRVESLHLRDLRHRVARDRPVRKFVAKLAKVLREDAEGGGKEEVLEAA